MHPSRRLLGRKSSLLRGKRIVLAVSGSIAAVESVKLAHELIRHGAEVIPVMTRAAQDLITPLALEFATGNAPVTRLTGKGEHVALCDAGPGSADLLLVAPATANTVSKIALGIDDTVVTSCATVALGAGLPVIVAPAMHEVMGEHPAMHLRLKELVSMGVTVVAPRIEEEKAKIATPEAIAHAVIHRLAEGPWKGKRVLVISGSTAEPWDPVRVITNRSSGRMGVELAVAAHLRGADVSLWNAWGLVPLPEFAAIKRFERVEDLRRLVRGQDLSRFDAIFVPAALSDFGPKRQSSKVSSEAGAQAVWLAPLPKVLPEIRRKAPKAVLVGFKAESEASKLVEKARSRLLSYDAQLFVANTSDAFGAASTEVLLVEAKGTPKRVSGEKSEIASRILEAAARHLGGRRR